MGEIGGSLHLDSGTLTPLLNRLELQGLVERAWDPADERRVLITLTADGSALRARASTIPARIYERCGVDAETGLALLKSLGQIVRTLGQVDERAGPPS